MIICRLNEVIKEVVMFSGVQSEWKVDYDEEAGIFSACSLNLTFKCACHIFLFLLPGLSPTHVCLEQIGL